MGVDLHPTIIYKLLQIRAKIDPGVKIPCFGVILKRYTQRRIDIAKPHRTTGHAKMIAINWYTVLATRKDTSIGYMVYCLFRSDQYRGGACTPGRYQMPSKMETKTAFGNSFPYMAGQSGNCGSNAKPPMNGYNRNYCVSNTKSNLKSVHVNLCIVLLSHKKLYFDS